MTRNAPIAAINRAKNQAINQSEIPPHDGVKALSTNGHFTKNKRSLTKNPVSRRILRRRTRRRRRGRGPHSPGCASRRPGRRPQSDPRPLQGRSHNRGILLPHRRLPSFEPGSRRRQDGFRLLEVFAIVENARHVAAPLDGQSLAT